MDSETLKQVQDIDSEILTIENEMYKNMHIWWVLIPEMKEVDNKIYEQKQLQSKYEIGSKEYNKHLELRIKFEKEKLELMNDFKNKLEFLN